MNNHKEIKWMTEPEEKDYSAASSYLSLLYKEKDAETLSESLKSVGISKFKAKDIFRASGLSFFGVSNSHVEKDREKIKNDVAISPILLVRDSKIGKVIIADGYHRLCAVYSLSEDEWIPCKIV
jgi:disulfide oxidoreductase YuzD